MTNFKKTTQLFPFRFPGVPCDIFGCYKRAAWVVGRPDGPLTDCFKLCPDCVSSMLADIPEDLQHGPKQAEPEPVPIPEPNERLFDMTVKELRKLAVEANIAGYSNMTKAELVDALLRHQSGSEQIDDAH
jgi:Rho termination factor, N-terminal domain